MLFICSVIVCKSPEGIARHLEFWSAIFSFCVSALKNCLLALLKPVNRLYTHLVWIQTMLTSHLVKCECDTEGLSLLKEDNTLTFKRPLEMCIECSNILHWKSNLQWMHVCSVYKTCTQTVCLIRFHAITHISHLSMYVHHVTGWRTSELLMHADPTASILVLKNTLKHFDSFWLPSRAEISTYCFMLTLRQANLSKMSTALWSARWHLNGTPGAPVCPLRDWKSFHSKIMMGIGVSGTHAAIKAYSHRSGFCRIANSSCR